MRGVKPIVLAAALLVAAFAAVAQPAGGKNPGGRLATHTVLGEYVTSTLCGYCTYAHGTLQAVHQEREHTFFHVSLVWDKNAHAASRADELGIGSFPTLRWDGSYESNDGARSVDSAAAAYGASIASCASRAVADIEVAASATWLGSAAMSITVTVTNHQPGAYTGRLRCYVTEVVSSMGWCDKAGNPYTFPFLDYAFDQEISVPPGGVWSDTVAWNGAAHSDGYGNSFAGLVRDNTFVIAAVFDAAEGCVEETAGCRPADPRTDRPGVSQWEARTSVER
jgi:hypothetical protein